MARITDTPLFKAIAPAIKSLTKRQLAKELAIVKKGSGKCGISFDTPHLDGAFVWEYTPQGDKFWRELFKEWGVATCKRG